MKSWKVSGKVTYKIDSERILEVILKIFSNINNVIPNIYNVSRLVVIIICSWVVSCYPMRVV